MDSLWRLFRSNRTNDRVGRHWSICHAGGSSVHSEVGLKLDKQFLQRPNDWRTMQHQKDPEKRQLIVRFESHKHCLGRDFNVKGWCVYMNYTNTIY